MSKKIETYFAKFPHLQDPNGLRAIRRGVRATSITRPGAVTVIHPLPEDAPQYAQIGKIAVEWANLEAKIDDAISYLLGAPRNLSACVTAQMIGPAPRLKALEALCSEKGLEVATDEIAEFGRHATGVGEQRNRFVHDPWHVRTNELTGSRAIKTSITAKGRLKIMEEEVSNDEFERIIFKIRMLNDIFDFIVAKHITGDLPA